MTKKMDRKGYIGGSDVHHVFNLAPYGCTRRLWYEKRGIETDYPLQENYHMKRGKEFEGNALRKYKKQTGRKLINKMPPLHLDAYPFIVGHVDSVVKSDMAPVEVKCPSPRNFAKIKRENEIPEGFILQLHHYFGLLNADYGAYAIFSTETTELLTFDVLRNQKLIDTIIQAEIEFWEKVQKAIEPERLPITDKRCQTCNWRRSCQGISQEIEQSFWDREQAAIRYDLTDLVQEYQQAKAIEKEAEEYVGDVACRLKQKLGDEQVVEVDGARVYLKPYEQWRWDTKALETKHPELIQEFKKKSIITPLKVYNF